MWFFDYMQKIKNNFKMISYFLKLKMNVKIFILFFFYKIIFFLLRIKNKNKIYQNNIKLFYDKFFENKTFSTNFFIANIDMMEFFFNRNKNLKIKSFMEIGSFEGSSICYFLKKLDQCQNFVCVDIWDGVEELKDINFSEVEKKFDLNTINEKNVKKMKMTSDMYFENNSEMFDLIYVDGNHHSSQLKKDLENSFKFLNKNGILIIDDFLWNWYEDPRSNPAHAVNIFFNENNKFLKILFVHNIVILQKKS